MRRNKIGKTVPQDLFVFLVLGLLAAVLAAVVHLLYHTEYAETSTPNDCFAAVSATATGETAVPKIVCLTFDDGPSAHTPEKVRRGGSPHWATAKPVEQAIAGLAFSTSSRTMAVGW